MRIILSLWLIVASLSANDIYATFDVVAQKKANIAFNTGGIVKAVYVDISSVVKKGDTLAVLKNNDVKAMLKIHKTTLKYAKKDYDRQIKIQNLIDKAKFDNYEKIYESAKAQVTYQQALLEKTILKAPFEGVIISKEIENGDVVSGQQIKTAFQIQSATKRKLILEFDQKYHNVVKIGDTYNYRLDGDDKLYSGTITKVYPYANTTTRKIKAEVLTKDFVVGLFGDGYIVGKK